MEAKEKMHLKVYLKLIWNFSHSNESIEVNIIQHYSLFSANPSFCYDPTTAGKHNVSRYRDKTLTWEDIYFIYISDSWVITLSSDKPLIHFYLKMINITL